MKALRLVVRLGALAAAGLALGFALFLAARPAAPARVSAPAAAVLTGGPGRIELGLSLLARGEAGLLLISGVHPDASLADLLREARATPPPPGQVVLGYWARSTRGNAREIAAFAQARRLASVAVVTQRMHMPRALVELRRAAPGLALLPVPVPDPDGTLLLRRAWPEYLRFLGALGGLSALIPPREDGAPAAP